jgi:hypothetical protein
MESSSQVSLQQFFNLFKDIVENAGNQIDNKDSYEPGLTSVSTSIKELDREIKQKAQDPGRDKLTARIALAELTRSFHGRMGPNFFEESFGPLLASQVSIDDRLAKVTNCKRVFLSTFLGGSSFVIMGKIAATPMLIALGKIALIASVVLALGTFFLVIKHHAIDQGIYRSMLGSYCSQIHGVINAFRAQFSIQVAQPCPPPSAP